MDLMFYAAAMSILVLTYYFVIVRGSRKFMKGKIGFEYYDFGKFNVLLKTVAFLIAIGLVVLIGRFIAFLVQ